ncbi:glycoside hydrolase [Mycena filopes]|nr:glycoside hydrolase [Mycena filopes]
MRRRTVQYLVLLAVASIATHVYFYGSALPGASSVPDWMDLNGDHRGYDANANSDEWDVDSHAGKGSGREGEEEIAGGRYIKPNRPSRPKGQDADADAHTGEEGAHEGHVHGDEGHEGSRPVLTADVRKRDAVVDAFKHAWSAYERDAFGSDEYHPISHRGSDLGSGGGIGYTVVDALDTMLLMGAPLAPEYARARKWVKEKLTFERSGYFSMFETTIRVLGGLLSAHHLTGDSLYLQHAADLGDRMLPAFDTPSGIPAASVNLGGRGSNFGGGSFSLAEATTLQLEFRYLAHLTGRAVFWHKAERVMQVVNRGRLESGLAPVDIGGNGDFVRSRIGMGSNGDSYYEYLLKQYLQTNRTEPVYLQMYEDAMQGVHDYMVWKTPTDQLTYIAELLPVGTGKDWKNPKAWTAQPKQEHLACFLAGSLMLGATTAHALPAHVPPRMSQLTAAGRRDWATGVALLDGCLDTLRTETGLSPEGVHFRTPADTDARGEGKEGRDWYVKGSKTSAGGTPPYDARYMLRPEISESIFLAYRLTGDPRYRAAAWDLFSAIERHCRLPGGGYATVLDVEQVPVQYLDKQETFFLSETLKYLFLTFADEGVLDLGEVVFNTEAHPLPVFEPGSDIQPKFTEYS